MPISNPFLLWFFYGLNGLGGWLIFLLLALTATIWLLYDSASRRLPAVGWRIGVIVATVLLLPAVLHRFTVTDLESMGNSPVAPFSEQILFLGLLGGILPVVCAIGFYVTYRGLVGCPKGHEPYDAGLGECPECARLQVPTPAPVARPIYVSPPQTPAPLYPPPTDEPASPSIPPKPKAQAWLVAGDGRSYQLNQFETTIGRSSQNDIHLSGDPTLGRQHAKIVEKDSRFRLVDLGARNFTRVNGRIVRVPVLLESGDEIQFGDNTVLRFVTGRS